MKSILFLMLYYLDDEEKMRMQKFNDQMEAARDMNLDVFYIGYLDGKTYLCHNEKRILLRKQIVTKFRPLQRNLVYNSVENALAENNGFDYAYIRDMLSLPSTVRATRLLKDSGSKTIMEISTYTQKGENSSDQRLFRRVLLKILKYFERKTSAYIDLYALIGNEAKTYLDRPAVNIENGVKTETLPAIRHKTTKDEIHLLCLAKMSRWHGYDRLFEGLNEYKCLSNRYRVIVHMVGSDGDGSLKKWKQLVEQLSLQDTVLFEGMKYGDELTQIINECDVGIGALGLYRKGLYLTSELKIREYCARGLPFIYSAKDTALCGELEFCYKVPNDNTPIDVSRIIEFCLKTREIKNLPEKMRSFAKEKMTWQAQFSKLFYSTNTNADEVSNESC